MLCLTEEFSRFYIEVLNQFLTIDLETFNEVHPEEWELIKPDKKERSIAMVSQIRADLTETGSCGQCTHWKMKSAELKGLTEVNELNAGQWEPTQGLHLKDDLFPHVHGGLRKRLITVTAVNVS